MMLGSYILDSCNNDSKLTKLFSSLVLFFFGGILVVYNFSKRTPSTLGALAEG